jgi:hypothetical protein
MPSGAISYMPRRPHQSAFWQISMQLDRESAAEESLVPSSECSLRGAARRSFYLYERSGYLNPACGRQALGASPCRARQISLDCTLYKLWVELRRHTTDLYYVQIQKILMILGGLFT